MGSTNRQETWDADGFFPSDRFFYFPGKRANKTQFTEAWTELKALQPWDWHAAAFAIFNKVEESVENPNRYQEFIGKYVMLLAFDTKNNFPILCGWLGKFQSINAPSGLVSCLVSNPEELMLHLTVVAEPTNWGVLCKVSAREKDHSALALMGDRAQNATHIALLGPFDLKPILE